MPTDINNSLSMFINIKRISSINNQIVQNTNFSSINNQNFQNANFSFLFTIELKGNCG